MRVGIDTTKLADRDGLGVYVRELVMALAPLDIDLVLDCRDTDPKRIRACFEPGMSIAIERDPVDIDLYHITAWQLPRFQGPLITTCYDLTFLSHPHTHTLDNRIVCLTGVLEASLAGARFVSISQTTRDALRDRLGIESDVIYPGVAKRFQPHDASHLGVAPGRDLEPGFVLSVGTRQPRKNLDRLYAAHRALPAPLRERHPLLLVGSDGWGEIALPDDPHVMPLGEVSDHDLPALFSHAACFAYPSLAEGFGMPVIEAMACGAPVVTSDRGALREAAGDAARLVEPTDVDSIREGLAAVLEDSETATRLRRRGFKRAARFHWSRCATEMLALYQRSLTA
ncbi:MAG: glycosyltransferase family 1 protein [Acidobacteriota bacterium]